MHGRLKIRTTEEQAEAKKKEQQEKLKKYLAVTTKIYTKREKEEYDEEGLELTGRILEQNSEFYTLWNYRREILLFMKGEKGNEELKNIALTELNLTQHCLQTNPKSYGAWHHRFWTMEYNPEADWKKELKLCGYFLSQDERNFHCWDYRRRVCKKCEVTAVEELAFSTEHIESNFSNYSAWHYRSTLLPVIYPGPVKGSVQEGILLKELDLIQNAAFTDPDDQSVWFYHRWLLGRSKMPFQVLNISLINSQNVAVLLSEPISVPGYKYIKLQINGTDVDILWKPVPSSSPFSSLWIGDISKYLGSEHNSIISVECTKGNVKSSLSLCVNGDKPHIWSKPNRADAFSAELSAATKEVLEQELESCEQLYELEPNCKWTIFTSVLLMRALNGSKYEEKITNYMEQLKKVDIARKTYYDDLGSKFIIENYIENLPVDSEEIKFSKLNLTSLHHFDHLLLIEKINLSSNHLTSVLPLCYLISIKCIILDDNQLTNLTGLEELKNLQILSVKKNLIEKVSNLEILLACENLQELHFEENPVVNSSEYFSLQQKLSNLKVTTDIST